MVDIIGRVSNNASMHTILRVWDCRSFVQDTGVRLESPPVAKRAPGLDLIQSRAYDAPHSEWRGWYQREKPVTDLTNALSSRHALAGSCLTKRITIRALEPW